MTVPWARVDSFVGNFSSSALAFYRPCPICQSLRSRAVLTISDFQFYTDSSHVPKRVNVYENQCLDCFALYLNPCYSDYGFSILFAEAGQSYGSTEGRPNEQIEWMTGGGLLRSGACVLDVGCYDGRFLARLPGDVKKAGVDVDAPAIERGRQQFGAQGIEFVLGNLESFEYDGSPDTITMFHVLEHLPGPVSVLRNLRSTAHPSTRLVVEVPILENGITNDINGFFSVQHMTHFSRRSLRNCLEQAGWRVIEWQEQAEYNGCRVLAEPDEHRATITNDPSDVGSLHLYFSEWHRALAEVNRKLSDLSGIERCIVWGGGAHTEILYQTTSFFQSDPAREYLIVDSDVSKHGKTWRGIAIESPSILKKVEWSDTRLVISSYGSQEKIAEVASGSGVPAERIIRLYNGLRIY